MLYARAALEDLPPELAGQADALTVVLPWAGLLAAVARPEPGPLGAVRGLCRPGATLDAVLSLDPRRDRSEVLRLGLPSLDPADLERRLPGPYAAAGFGVRAIRPLGREELARWPSTWARRLAQAHPRCVVRLAARAV